MPFKLNQDHRHHVPRQTHKVANSLGALLRSWPAYEAGLRQRGSLTVWFSDEAIAAWAAEPRATRGRHPPQPFHPLCARNLWLLRPGIRPWRS